MGQAPAAAGDRVSGRAAGSSPRRRGRFIGQVGVQTRADRAGSGEALALGFERSCRGRPFNAAREGARPPPPAPPHEGEGRRGAGGVARLGGQAAGQAPPGPLRVGGEGSQGKAAVQARPDRAGSGEALILRVTRPRQCLPYCTASEGARPPPPAPPHAGEGRRGAGGVARGAQRGGQGAGASEGPSRRLAPPAAGDRVSGGAAGASPHQVGRSIWQGLRSDPGRLRGVG